MFYLILWALLSRQLINYPLNSNEERHQREEKRNVPEPNPVTLVFSGSSSKVNFTAFPRSSSNLRSLTKCCNKRSENISLLTRGYGLVLSQIMAQFPHNTVPETFAQLTWLYNESVITVVNLPLCQHAAHSVGPQTSMPIGQSACGAPLLSFDGHPKWPLKHS